MGNNCSFSGYYTFTEVDDLDHIIPQVFPEDEDEEVPLSSRETLLLRRSRTTAGKKSSTQFRSSRYRTSTLAPKERPGSGRSRKSRRTPLKKRSMKNTDSGIDFRAINSIICNKTPLVLAFLASDTKLSIKHRNTRNPSGACSGSKRATRDCVTTFHQRHQYRSQQWQNSKYNSCPCVQYCKSCKINAFPCADYCQTCYNSVSRRSRNKNIVNEHSGPYHRHHPLSGRTSPRAHIKMFD